MAAPTQQRVLLIAFDGTHCDSVSPNSRTIVTTIADTIENSTRPVDIRLVGGCGTGTSVFTKYIEGAIGEHQCRQFVLDATYHLMKNYRDGDEIVVIGYSRGAATARSFVGFLDRVGLPVEQTDGILHKLYHEYTSGTFPTPGIVPHLNREARGRPISIQTLLCIDTVESLGFPRTGMFTPVTKLPFVKERSTIMEPAAASNVRVLLQALALHETRAAFEEQLMYIPENSDQILKQVYFPGTHTSIARESHRGHLSDYVFAWAVANLERHSSLTFNESRLLQRLPQIEARIPLAIIVHHGFPNEVIRESNKGFWPLCGSRSRIPQRSGRLGMRTNERIHISARLRGHGISSTSSAVPGYELGPADSIVPCWNEVDGCRQVYEDEFTERERQLLGIV